MQPIFLLLWVFMSICVEDSMPEAILGYMVQNNEKITQAVRWMGSISARGREHPGTVGTGQFLELGGGCASQGILPFPPERTVTALVFAGLEAGRRTLQKGLPCQRLWQRKGVPLLSNHCTEWVWSSGYKALLLHYCSQNLQEGNCTNIAYNNQTVRGSKEGTMNSSLISLTHCQEKR